MKQLDLKKLEAINKEAIKNPERFLGEKKMTKEVLESALKDALKKIDKLWDDMNGLFPSETSKDNIYPAVENTQGWCQEVWILVLALPLTA